MMLKYIATCLVLGLALGRKLPLTPGPGDVIKIRMPSVTPNMDDYYGCTDVKVTTRGKKYIVKYEPEANADVAHHILIFGCGQRQTGGRCGGGCKIIYAWAKNAPPLELPKDVGYRIGGDSGINYITMQVHYASKFKDGQEPDSSGVNFYLTTEQPKYIAGIYLALTGGADIPPNNKKTDADISCLFHGDVPIYPFAFRTHAHTLGKVITGYQVNVSESGQEEYHLIGKGNPQWPQAFYPTPKHLEIKKNDKILARCVFSSIGRNRHTYIGSTHNDEMCNLYIMYYTEAKYGVPYTMCGGNRYPQLWKNAPKDSDDPLPYNPLLEERALGQRTHTDHIGLRVVAGWPQGGLALGQLAATVGQVAGVATDNDGNVVIFHRGSHVWGFDTFEPVTNVYTKQSEGPIKEDTLLMLNPQGQIIKKWGANLFYLPHGLHIDHENNVWVTDVALHQVFKFKMGSNAPNLTLGERFKPGHDREHFCKPTDVAVLENGDFYVSDGYCNHRVVKFSSQKMYLFEWGHVNTGPQDNEKQPLGNFYLPHSITYVNGGNKKLICVGDRENNRIQCFDLNGNNPFQLYTKDFGGPKYAISYNKKNDLLYAVSGQGDPTTKQQGATYSLTSNGQSKLLDLWSPHNKGFSNPHDVASSPSGDAVYVVEIGPNRIFKFRTSYSDRTRIEKKSQLQKHFKPEDTLDVVNLNTRSEGEKKTDKKDKKPLDISSPPVFVAIILIVPVVIVLIVTIVIKVRKHRDSSSFFKTRTSKPFTLGGLLNRRRGFEKLNTDELDPLNSDSENEMFDAALTGKA